MITLRYFVGPGNNPQIIKNVFKQRYWWTAGQKEDFRDANFIWTQWKRNIHFQYLQKYREKTEENPAAIPKFYAKVDHNNALTNKKSLFLNMVEYYNKIGKDPFDVLPRTFLVRDDHDVKFQAFCSYYEQL